MYSTGNVASHATSNDFYVSIRGQVYDITRFAKQDHGTSTYPAGPAELAPWAGQDLSYDFPIPLSQGCYGLVSDDSVKVIPNITIALPTFIHYSGPTDQSDPSLTAMRQENWYFNTFSPAISPYKVGYIVIPMSTVQADYSSWGRSWAVIDGSIYDLSDYFATAKTYSGVAGVPNYHYIDSQLEQLFQQYGGEDISSYVAKYKSLVSPTTYAYNMNCLKNMFYVGSVDVRMGVKCQITNYLLLAFAALMCLIILVKFLAALQFGSKSTPEDQDKFVICQVPCYTEGEESLRKTINSLTTLRYDDKRKLLLLICDGMVMGSGNERPTPRIVLDILGADPLKDPEPLMFKSVAEGSRQLNYGKVYSGLYEYEGQCVPYMVIVKVGKASERSKPGNRGKRDSQIILMRFLNRVHFDGDMSPLELEMYHQMKNVIGVNPSFYEYILMVDADTEVMPDALQRLISSMLHDGKVIGICGETTIENEQKSWTTMIQVYEYFISHHLAKAFESIFGSVTCLPGCFCMYRVRTPSKQMPLIISNKVIGDYCDNHVDTLHKKNLLHLGEDRYLTTLMMKHFPQYKMKFNPHAKCKTTAPEKWSVLLSQRRRWINSTVHNLLELVFLPELCGFCCFSMRFVVMIDLVGTFLLPSSVVYIVYLLYVAISGNGPFPLISIVMLASIYGLQAIIFIFKREWQYIGWMIIYILAIPVFSFFLPIYSFWHFDDFSWGNTRVVVGDKKKIIVSADEEKFDERMIPMKKWSTYEQELWEMGSGGSHDSRGTRITARTYQSRLTGSVNGSQVDFGSQYGGTQYDYYRDTNVSQQNEKQRSASSSRSTLLPNYMDNGYSSGDFGVDRLTMYGFNPNRASYALSNRSFGDLDTMSHPGLLRPGSVMSTSQMYQRATSPSLVPLNPTNGDESMPTDAMIVAEIKSILASADLMSITKKQVREQLSTFFGVDLSSKREFINHTIESVLQEPQ
ncbi:hypothetical protein BZG36_05748 [Bifiguratus adelaidae]|uniref:chitin synthase n=1 Tax=Bifiguratus adelaidae TaxID=1938954 RepID=A0A261XST9_9FUNG|nr:hypothetical protein BZG36_05748 [Bifiguratus adelaidae]